VAKGTLRIIDESKAKQADACERPPARRRVKDLKRLAPLLKALADDTRLEIVSLLALADEELCVCDIEERFDLSQPTISHHLRVLKDAGVVTSERRGSWVYYALRRDTLLTVRSLVDLASDDR
jgi:ArsR family transcriptional regulator, arsenate/arsenite/antimonite-responsive transcriptional repressor